MPNRSNISQPINIHGFGRSGTTVLQNILGQTGFVQVCNETAPLVFNSYRGGELLLPSHDKEVIGLPGDGSAAIRTVHAAFCDVAYSNKPSWCQKLGGIPNSVVWETIITDEDRAYATKPYEFPYAWYWRVLKTVFPHSRDILILRDWRDIVASRTRYSGYKPTDVARDLAIYWNAMLHPDARLHHVVALPTLSNAPGEVVPALFASLGIQYRPEVLRALDWYASGRDRDLADGRKTGFSWQDGFGGLDSVLQRTLEAIMAPTLERMERVLPGAIPPPGA